MSGIVIREWLTIFTGIASDSINDKPIPVDPCMIIFIESPGFGRNGKGVITSKKNGLPACLRFILSKLYPLGIPPTLSRQLTKSALE